MSKLKVTTISDPDNDNTAITVDTSGNVTFAQNATFSGTVTGISSYADSDALDLFNVTGSAPVYACRAWCNFNGTTNTINASGNISSVTDQGLGDYQFNFTTAMPDVNYAWSCSWDGARGQSAWAANPNASPSWHLTTSLRIEWENTYADTYANADLTTATMMVIR